MTTPGLRAVFPCASSPRCITHEYARVSALNVNMFSSCLLRQMSPSEHTSTLNTPTGNFPILPPSLKANPIPRLAAGGGRFIGCSRSGFVLESLHAAAALLQSGPSSYRVVLYGRHMTVRVHYTGPVVGGDRLPLKARPRSAPSLVG